MPSNLSRRSVLGGLTGGLAVASTGLLASPALARGAGDFRALSLVNHRTAEKLNSVYWVDGHYIPEALEAFNYILRDWREDEAIGIDPKSMKGSIEARQARHSGICARLYLLAMGSQSRRDSAPSQIR